MFQHSTYVGSALGRCRRQRNGYIFSKDVEPRLKFSKHFEIASNHVFNFVPKSGFSKNQDMLQGCQLHMNPIVKSLLEFNEAFEIPKRNEPGLGSQELIELRIKLLEEEVQEYAEAARAGDLVEVLDALADIGYILAGTIINHGMQDIFDASFDEVHRSNMAKLVDGRVLRREDGKVLKPDGWTPPNLGQFLKQ